MELELEAQEAAATEDEIAAEQAAAETTIRIPIPALVTDRAMRARQPPRDAIEGTGAKSLRRRLGAHRQDREAHRAGDMGYPGSSMPNASPPEDVGGPWGYEEYLEAIASPRNERHTETIQWRGPGFDPSTVDTDDIKREVAAPTRKWAPESAKPRQEET